MKLDIFSSSIMTLILVDGAVKDDEVLWGYHNAYASIIDNFLYE